MTKLPSIGELLKHPKVEQVVQRVNQSTVAKRAAGFLEEMRTNVQQRAGQSPALSIHQLAERLAQRLLGTRESSNLIVNATGVVWSEHGPALPLAQPAIHEMLQLASEYHEQSKSLLEQVSKTLTHLATAESAWIVDSFAVAAHIAQELSCDSLRIARHAGIIDPADFELEHVDTLGDHLRLGAELVIADGAGLIGGPPCGIVVGSHATIERFAEHPLAVACEIDELKLTALAATLNLTRDRNRAMHEIPVWQLLSTPLENLQQRCERLATLMAEAPGIASAEPMAVDSIWLETPAEKLVGPSWAICLKFSDHPAEEVAKRWSDLSPQVSVRAVQDALRMDLRSVFPRWDQTLIDTVEGLANDE